MLEQVLNEVKKLDGGFYSLYQLPEDNEKREDL